MASDRITLGNPILVNKAKPLNYLYGPYESLALAQASLPQKLRYLGLTVGVITDGVITEYWFKEGLANENLIEKITSSPSPGPQPQPTGDADTVDGYHVEVMYPALFNPSLAKADTIYFLYKISDRIIALPVTTEVTYEAGWEGYMPQKEAGWNFVNLPTLCVNVGTYPFQVELSKDTTVWADGTTTNKTKIVIVNPFIVEVDSHVEVPYTGNPISISQICPTPQGVTCSYVILEGNPNLIEKGTYTLRLSLSDPNCAFSTGATKDIEVEITDAIGYWAFGDGFPIVFGQSTGMWAFGGNFPLRFS